MSSEPLGSLVNFSSKVYDRLLRLYPAKYRQEYGPLMVQLFRDQCRDAYDEDRCFGVVRLWFCVSLDLIKTTLIEHLSETGRIKHMLTKLLFAMNKPRKRSWPVTVLVFLLVFLTAAAVTFLLPVKYKSLARIELLTVVPGTARSPEHPGQTIHDPTVIQTEIERIRSTQVLYPVINALGLCQRWGDRYGAGRALREAEALDLLQKQLDVRLSKRMSLLEIRVSSPDAREPSEIANAIVERYRELSRAHDLFVSPIDRAEMNFRPVGPNVPLNLGLGFVVALFAASLFRIFQKTFRKIGPRDTLAVAPQS